MASIHTVVYFMLHYLEEFSANLRYFVFHFMEEFFEATHSEDYIFSELTLHSQCHSDNHYNSWEYILHNKAAMASLLSAGIPLLFVTIFCMSN